MSEQLNVRIPMSTDMQIEELRKWTEMTQTQLVILAIDRLHQSQKRVRATIDYEKNISQE